MKGRWIPVFTILLLVPGTFFSSCKKAQDPLLITDAEEPFSAYSAAEEEMETVHLEPDGMIPADSYITKDRDLRCEKYVCESEKRIYYVSSVGYLDHFSENSRKFLYYADKESGEHGVLCSEKGCQHNSADCRACLGNDAVAGLTLYDGKILCALQHGSDHPDIRIVEGETDGSGFTELGMIPAESYEADSEGNWTMECFFHRGYCYFLSEKVVADEQDNPYSREPNYTGLMIRAVRIPLENLNITEELFKETLEGEWISAFPFYIVDQDDVYFGIRLSREDPEDFLKILSGALRLYRLTGAEKPEELYNGEIPAMGGIYARDGSLRLIGRSFEKNEKRVLRYNPETRKFASDEAVSFAADPAAQEQSFAYSGEYYYSIMQDLWQSGAREEQPRIEDRNFRIRFFAENGSLLSEKVLNVGKILEKLNLSSAEFNETTGIYINPFAMDRDAYYGLLNISNLMGSKQYQAVLQIPVEEEEDWSIFLEGGKEK